MELTKRALQMFIKTKSMLNSKHEFCLVIAQDISSPFIVSLVIIFRSKTLSGEMITFVYSVEFLFYLLFFSKNPL